MLQRSALRTFRVYRGHQGACAPRFLSSARDDLPGDPSSATDPWGLPMQTIHNSDSPEDVQAAVEPHPQDRPRQNNEDVETLRSRLVYQTRKRGTLETGLLLSTFATVDRLKGMSESDLRELDRLLCVPEWTLYYWSIGKQTPPDDSPWANSQILEQLREHSANKGGVVRAMPELPHTAQ